MFDNINGARLAAKRVQGAMALKSSVSREVVARIAGYGDWHGLEKTVGTASVPTRGVHASFAAYAATHGISAEPATLLALIVPGEGGCVLEVTSGIMLTEAAMRMLTALHCGCNAHIWNSETDGRYCDIVTHRVAPYTFTHSYWKNHGKPDAELMHEERTEPRRIEGWLEADEMQDYGDTSPPKRRGTYDHSRTVRLDNWSGDDRREECRDGLMLVRAGLVTYDMADLHITDAGRAIAQAHVGDGREIRDGEAQVVRVAPDHAYAIGCPGGFQMMDETGCRQRIKLAYWHGKIQIRARSDIGHLAVDMTPVVAKTLASFLADVGKVDRDTTARFGDVQVTLEAAEPAATLAFGDDDNMVRARLPRALARLTRTYLGELAKGHGEEAELMPVDVSWSATFASRPASMAA